MRWDDLFPRHIRPVLPNPGRPSVTRLKRQEAASAQPSEVRLMPAKDVQAYVKRNKNDAADVETICEAACRPTYAHVEAVFIAVQVKNGAANLIGVDMQHVLRTMQEARDGVLRRASFPVNLLG
jgi:hypothetical protein